MSGGVNVRLVILLSEELRDAARTLKALRGLPEDTPGEVLGPLLNNAVQACHTALYHLVDDPDGKAIVVMAAESYLSGKKRGVGR